MLYLHKVFITFIISNLLLSMMYHGLNSEIFLDQCLQIFGQTLSSKLRKTSKPKSCHVALEAQHFRS